MVLVRGRGYRYKAKVSEDGIQTAIVNAFRLLGRADVKMVHVPNELADTEGKRIWQASLGMWPGCPDLIFLTPPGEPTCFIECKRTAVRIRSNSVQDLAREWCVAHGHRWALVNDPDSIIPTLDGWGLLRFRALTGGL